MLPVSPTEEDACLGLHAGPLVPPVPAPHPQLCADRAGNVFNKEALITYTLHKAERTIPAFSHIRSLKTVRACENGMSQVARVVWHAEHTISAAWHAKHTISAAWHAKHSISAVSHAEHIIGAVGHAKHTISALWHAKHTISALWHAEHTISAVWRAKHRDTDARGVNVVCIFGHSVTRVSVVRTHGGSRERVGVRYGPVMRTTQPGWLPVARESMLYGPVMRATQPGWLPVACSLLWCGRGARTPMAFPSPGASLAMCSPMPCVPV